MRIAIGSDHAGYELKERIKKYLVTRGHEVIDKGCVTTESNDYPDFGEAVALEVSNKSCEYGIIICGTGIGISIVANKVPGVRAALCLSKEMAYLARAHNDANVIAIGARIKLIDEVEDIIITFITSSFEGGRHKKRVEKIKTLEEKYRCK